MHRLMIVAFIVSLLPAVNAQITIDFLPVPEDGDTIALVSTVDPGPLDLGSGGLDQSWTFQFDQAVPVNTVVEQNMQDTIFASANRILTTGPVNAFYQITDQEWIVLGLTSVDPLGFGFVVESKYTTPLTQMRAPLSFTDAHFQSTRLITNIPLEVVPDSVLNMLPLVPDSLRLAIATFRNEVVDAAGMLEVNGNSWTVLRQKRTDIIELVFEAKISVLPWTDVTPLILPFLPEGIELMDTMTSYRFLAEGENTPVAEVFVGQDSTVERVDYVGEPLVASTREKRESLAAVHVFPNPGRGQITVTSPDLHQTAAVRIIDLAGRILPCDWRLNNNHSIGVTIQSAHTGLVVVELIDDRARVISRAALMVVH